MGCLRGGEWGVFNSAVSRRQSVVSEEGDVGEVSVKVRKCESDKDL